MSDDEAIGTIELITGPMFSGKTTRLIENIRKYAYKNKKTIMVSFTGDKRYTDKSEVVTHDQMKYDSIQSNTLSEKFNILKNYDCIGIDEGQFFPDLVEVCEELADMGKLVIVAALSGDFMREPFSVIEKLIPKTDKIKLLKAYCFHCHKSAHYSLRIVASNEKILIGAGEAYRPACRKCFKFFSKAREMGTLDIMNGVTSKNNKEKIDDNQNTEEKTTFKVGEKK